MTHPKKQPRRAHDYYPTPDWCVHGLLSVFPPPGGHVVEPCAGHGHIVRVLRTTGYLVTAYELREGSTDEDLRGAGANVVHTSVDWLEVVKWQPVPLPYAFVTNPPFGLSFKIVSSIVERHPPYAAFLLRQSFLAAGKSRGWWNNRFPATQQIVLGKRPSFTMDGGTDAWDYVWLVYVPGADSRPTVVIDGEGKPY